MNSQTYKSGNKIRLVSITGKTARGYWFNNKTGIQQEDIMSGSDKGFFILANIKAGKVIGFVEMFEDTICRDGKVKITNAGGNVEFIKNDSIYLYIKNKTALKN